MKCCSKWTTVPRCTRWSVEEDEVPDNFLLIQDRLQISSESDVDIETEGDIVRETDVASKQGPGETGETELDDNGTEHLVF